ncbi:MAG: hypothetical protein JO103_02235 [Candidatus Eremiobacteraeota bacterium]|nr:hypothetical protein [Candidatus Eremiobacteraeota bacterium]
MRLPLWLYSNRNIAGSVLGLVALGAYFTGLVHEFWYVIVAGSYGIGALVARDSGALETHLNSEMSVHDAIDGVTKLADEARKRLPPDIANLAGEIAAAVAEVLPRLAAHGVADATFADVRSTATRYLPDTLNAYLTVPAAYRNTAVIADGKTARQIVVEQLTVLAGKMKEIEQDAVADDAQSLLANGRFLKERFAAAPMFRPT